MTHPSASLSLALATHVAGTAFDHLPSATVHAAKRALLDGIGVMLAASGLSREVRPFIERARQSGGGASRVLGTDVTADAAMAAFANGAMAHALDYEDAYDAAPVHPNASLIPALLALAQASTTPIDGRDLLAALTVGCDVACRLARALEQPMEQGGWYPPAILGAYGAAAGAARLLGLDARQTLDAWSLMLCQATCPGEIKYSADTVIRAVREAFPAQAAVQSAQLARAGVRGFDAPFEGRNGFFALYVDGRYSRASLLDDLGRHWLIDDLSFKPWPCCRGTHAYIEAAQHLRRTHALTPDDISSILVTGGVVQRMLAEPEGRKRHPQTVIDAKFSLHFTVAAALAHDDVTLESFGEARLADPALRSLTARTWFDQREGWGRDRATSADLRIETRDGRVLHHAVAEALGHPSRPLDDHRLRAKFADCARQAAWPLPSAAIGALAETLMRLEEVRDVRPVLSAASAPPA